MINLSILKILTPPPVQGGLLPGKLYVSPSYLAED